MQRDEDVLTETGIRRLRDKPVFMTPNVFPPDEPVETPTSDPATERRAALLRLQAEVRRDPPLLRPAVPAVRGAQLRQADRDGRPPRPGRAAHRWAGEDRVPGRHQAPAGGRIAHRHHPVPARRGPPVQPGGGLRRVVRSARGLRPRPAAHAERGGAVPPPRRTTHPRLDYIVNNACQTVRRPPAFYEHMLELESGRDRPAPGRGPPGARRARRRARARAARRARPGADRSGRLQRGAVPARAAAGGRGGAVPPLPDGRRSTRTSSRSTCAIGTRGGSRCRRCPPSSSSRRSS